MANSATPPVIPRAASAPKRLSLFYRVLIFFVSLLGLFVFGFIGLRIYQFAKFIRQPHAPTATSEFYAATSQTGRTGPKASGNSDDAVRLAKEMGTTMSIGRTLLFTQAEEKSMLDQDDMFKVYCDLRSDRCVFLVHVPELRRFDQAAQKKLGDIAWQSALATIGSSGRTNQTMRLAVGLRGNIMYERVLLGHYSAAGTEAALTPPEVEQGFKCEQKLIGWFTPPDTNLAPELGTEGRRIARP